MEGGGRLADYVLKELFGGERRLLLRGSLTEGNQEAIANNEFDSLELAEGNWQDIEPLLNYSKIRYLKISEDCNWDVLSQMWQLRHLNVENWHKARNFSFDNLKSLRSFSGKWSSKNFDAFFNLEKLQSVHLWGYGMSSLVEFSGFKNLNELGILFSKKLSSLEGIESLRSLRSLELERNPQLESIACLDKCKDLRFLRLGGCGRIKDYKSVAKLGSLSVLDIENCADLASLSILNKLSNLKRLRLGKTFVVDGKIKAIVLRLPELKFVYFINKQHYDIKNAELNLMLEEKFGELDWSESGIS